MSAKPVSPGAVLRVLIQVGVGTALLWNRTPAQILLLVTCVAGQHEERAVRQSSEGVQQPVQVLVRPPGRDAEHDGPIAELEA